MPASSFPGPVLPAVSLSVSLGQSASDLGLSRILTTAATHVLSIHYLLGVATLFIPRNPHNFKELRWITPLVWIRELRPQQAIAQHPYNLQPLGYLLVCLGVPASLLQGQPVPVPLALTSKRPCRLLMPPPSRFQK